MKCLKNYKSSIFLILSMVIGSILGLVFKENVGFLKPFGQLFLNLLYVIVVPVIFVTITSAITKINKPKRFGKIFISMMVVFVLTSLISATLGLISIYNVELFSSVDLDFIKSFMLTGDVDVNTSVNFLEKTVQAISVSDFSKLLNNDNIIALVVFSILVGISVKLSGEKGVYVSKLLDSLNEVVMNFIKIIMYYAPIGICCYFACMVGEFGTMLTAGYIKVFVCYLLVTLVMYFGIYSLYAVLSGKIAGFKVFWKNILPPTLTSLSTCSSAASIPINVATVSKMGISSDIGNTVIPLGTSFHKDGSIIGSVFKIMFLVNLFSVDIGLTKIVIVALVATLLVTAVPIGGGSISELLIITLLGFDIACLPLLTILATIIDAPATLLNVVGDTSSSMLVSKMVDNNKY